MAIGLLDLLLGGVQDPRARLGGEDTPAGGGILDAVGQRIMAQQAQPMQASSMDGAQPVQSAGYAPQQAQGVAAGDMRPQQQGSGLLGMLFGGGGRRGGTNSTVQWLVNKGFDPSAAQAIASDPQTLRQAVAQYGGPQSNNPKDRLMEVGGAIYDAQAGKWIQNPFAKSETPTDDIREYQEATRQGFKGSFVDYMTTMKRAGSTNINTGTIPTGYQAIYDENNNLLRYDPVPGGPADQEIQAANSKADMRQNQATITSDTVIDAANRAREAVDGGFLPSTGTVGSWIGGTIGESNAAEVMRQVDTLKSIAAAENLNAMRQASPTGGALGQASDQDIKLLKDKAGALDPSAGAERFKAALDDYERTLLRIVHGVQAGDRIFQETRKKPGGAASPKSGRPGADRFGTDSDWQEVAPGVRMRRQPGQ